MVAGLILFPLLNAGVIFHGSIRMGRLGLDWIIACFSKLSHWDFRKKKTFLGRALRIWRLPVDQIRVACL